MKESRGRTANGTHKQTAPGRWAAVTVVCRLILAMMITLCLAACKTHKEETPVSASDRPDHKISDNLDPERKALLKLYENPSVSNVAIKTSQHQNYFGDDNYYIDLVNATASIVDPDRTEFNYDLDENQVEQLNILISRYALTVYDDKPYWPTGNHCTMVVLFEFDIRYKDGYFGESGATQYPGGWEDFIRTLNELITNEKELPESTDTEVYEGAYEYDGYIENEPIHLSLVIDENRYVNGEYYFIDDPEPVKMIGALIGNNLQLYNVLENGSRVLRYILIRDTDGALKGVWKGYEQEYTCYLAESGSTVLKRNKPDMKWEQPTEYFEGSWYGLKSDYYSNSILRFVPLYDNLIYFEINTANGSYDGELNGIGRLDGDNVNYVENKVFLNFTVTEDKNIMLDSNNYQYKIHPTTPFESLYERRADGLTLPEMLSFMTVEENEQLKMITGDRYQDFLAVAQQGYWGTLAEAGDDLKLYDMNLRGQYQDALVVIHNIDGYMCAALKYYNEDEQRQEVHLFNEATDALIRQYIIDWSKGAEIVVQRIP